MRTRSSVLGVLLFLGVPLLAGGCYLGYRYRALREQAAWPVAEGRAALPRFLADRAAVQAAGIFTEGGGRQADAGAVLNPLKLPDDVAKALGKPDWPAFKPDWAGLDTGWFASLDRYDHWSLPRGQGVDEKGQPASPWREARPSLLPLIGWSKLRLLDGARRSDVPAASRDVRKLAQLLWSRGDLISAMVATALLRIETTFLTALRARGEGALLAGVTPLDPALPDQAKRFLMAYTDYLDFRAPADLREQVLAGPTAALGYCAAFNEARWRDLLVRPFLRHAYAKEFAALSTQAERAGRLCGPLPILPLLADESYIPPDLDTPDLFAMTDMGGTTPSALRSPASTRTVLKVPFLREAVGYILLSIAATRGVGVYSDAARGR